MAGLLVTMIRNEGKMFSEKQLAISNWQLAISTAKAGIGFLGGMPRRGMELPSVEEFSREWTRMDTNQRKNASVAAFPGDSKTHQAFSRSPCDRDLSLRSRLR